MVEGMPMNSNELQRHGQFLVDRATAERFFDSEPQVLLAEAATRGDIEGMQEALTRGADPNAVGRHEMTPLFWAMLKQSFTAYEFLLEEGADPNLDVYPPGGQGYGSPIEMAALMPEPDYLRAALKHGGDPNKTYGVSDFPIIYRAITHRQLDNIKLLLRHGAEINYQDESGGTPIIEAVTATQFEIALYLLREGADPTLSLWTGSSAVDFIKKYGNRGTDRRTNDLAAFDELVKELKDRGLLHEDPPRFE